MRQRWPFVGVTPSISWCRAWKECGDKGAAKRVATAIMARCSAATRLGEEDFVRGHTFETPKRHYQMVMKAAWVQGHDGAAPPADDPSWRDDPDADGLTAIDRQHVMFLANREIKAAALIPLKGLLEAVRKGGKPGPLPH